MSISDEPTAHDANELSAEQTTANSIHESVSGTAIMGRDFSGDISINVYGDSRPGDHLAASDLSVALPENVVRQQLRGRDGLQTELTALVETGGVQIVLCGAAGCGKSALAYVIADKVRAHRTVWWVDGTTRDTLVSGLFEVAVQAGVSRGDARQVWRNGESAKDLLWRALHKSTCQPWLLVVDNANDPSLLAGWVREPPAGNTVLTTSQDHRPAVWGQHAVLRQVLPISDVDGAAVLEELAPEAGAENEARELANRLGGLPLVLMLVGVYLGRTSTGPVLPEAHYPRSFAEYTSALDNEFPDTISALGRTSNDQVLARTWERSLDLLELQGVAAARPLFRLLAFFGAPVLPVVLLKASLMRSAPMLFPDLEVTDLEKAVDGLTRFGLIAHQRAGVDAFWLHSLIGEVTRMQPDAVEHARLYLSMRIGLLWRAATDHAPEDHSTWPTWQLLLPLCRFTEAETRYAGDDEYLLHAHLAFQAARYARSAGLWATAEEYYTTSLAFWTERTSPTNENVIAVRQNLALLKVDQGRFSEAESDLRDILEKADIALGPDHLATLGARQELARVLREQGRYDAAEREFSQLVPRMIEVLGPEHEHTLAARHERARTRRDLGDVEVARLEFENLAATMTRVLGAISPFTLATRHELAELLVRQEKLTEAQAILDDVVAIETQTRGADHPSTLVTRVSLADVGIRQGRHQTAETELRDILAAWSRAGADDHPHALVARSGLAAILADRGDLVSAEVEYRALLGVYADTFGDRHPQTVRLQKVIIGLLVMQDKRDVALRELRNLLSRMISALGRTHPDTIDVRSEIADLLYESNQFAAVESELRQIVNAQRRSLGDGHPDALVTQSKAAATLLLQGNVPAAQEELSVLVPRMERVLGASDDVLAARLNLAYAYQLLGHMPLAAAELRHVLKLCADSADDHEEAEATARAMLRQLVG